MMLNRTLVGSQDQGLGGQFPNNLGFLSAPIQNWYFYMPTEGVPDGTIDSSHRVMSHGNRLFDKAYQVDHFTRSVHYLDKSQREWALFEAKRPSFECFLALDSTLAWSIRFPMEEGSDGTLTSLHVVKDMDGKLLDEVRQAYNFALYTFHDLDKDLLKQAYFEAKILAKSGIFGGELYPKVSADPYGEFTFSHRSDAGYVDIGVRGEGELSYAVRNDKAPQETKFDDHDWRDHQIPQDLFKALKALREYL